MTWKQLLRTIEANSRRQQREVARRHRDLQRQYRELQRNQRELTKQAEQAQAANEVALYENYLDLLTSLHKDVGDAWSWQELLAAPAPTPPPRSGEHESLAQAQLTSYRPGLIDRMLGRDKKRIAVLQQAITFAREADEGAHRDAMGTYQREQQGWEYHRALASRVLGREGEAYGEALKHAGAFDDVCAFRSTALVTAARGGSDPEPSDGVGSERARFSRKGAVHGSREATGGGAPLRENRA